MLVLSRQEHVKESVVVFGPDGKEVCRVYVSEIIGRRARLAFQADKSVKFIRSEFLDKGDGKCK